MITETDASLLARAVRTFRFLSIVLLPHVLETYQSRLWIGGLVKE